MQLNAIAGYACGTAGALVNCVWRREVYLVALILIVLPIRAEAVGRSGLLPDQFVPFTQSHEKAIAVFDDCAAALHRDPRLRVVVTSNRGGRELDGVFVRRALEARAYMHDEKKIDASRIVLRFSADRGQGGLLFQMCSESECEPGADRTFEVELPQNRSVDVPIDSYVWSRDVWEPYLDDPSIQFSYGVALLDQDPRLRLVIAGYGREPRVRQYESEEVPNGLEVAAAEKRRLLEWRADLDTRVDIVDGGRENGIQRGERVMLSVRVE